MGYGPDWSGTAIAPTFTAAQDQSSTSFTGRIHPTTRFVQGTEDGFWFTKPNVQLTVNCAAVWAYEAVKVGLYDGAREDIGSQDTLITSFIVPVPEPGGDILFGESQALAWAPLWVVTDLEDFAGQCVLQVLGDD